MAIDNQNEKGIGGIFSSIRPQQKKTVVADAPPLVNVPENLEKPADFANGYGGQPAYWDPERQNDNPRRGSRIDKAITKPISGADFSDDSSSGLSVGKQVELEQGNAIQYRTCSWPKV